MSTAILLSYKMAVCRKSYTFEYNIRTAPMQAHGLYKLCPAALYGSVQSCYSIWCHMTHQQYWFENGERKLRHLFCYYRSCKNALTIHVLLGECTHFVTSISSYGIYHSKLIHCFPLHWKLEDVRAGGSLSLFI